MLFINGEELFHNGSKDEIMLDFVRICSNLVQIINLNDSEIGRIVECFEPLLKNEDVTLKIEKFNLEQKEEIISSLYEDIGIKRLGTGG